MKTTSQRPTVFVLRHMPQEGLGTLETALSRAGVEFRYFDLYRDVPTQLPLDEASGLVVLGGAMNVDEVEQYPFLALDICWIEQALALELPLLGVCLGSQLLAKALGSRVYPNRVKEIGWYPVELLPSADNDPLFAQSGARTVFQWHGDTFDLPSGATHLAAQSRMRKPGIPFRTPRLWYAISHRDDGRDDRRLASRARQLAGVEWARLHRPAENSPADANGIARAAESRGRCAGTFCRDVSVEGGTSLNLATLGGTSLSPSEGRGSCVSARTRHAHHHVRAFSRSAASAGCQRSAISFLA